VKKFIIILITLLSVLPLTPAKAEGSIVRITSGAHQSFNGQFRNDDLAQQLTPSGELGLLVYTPRVKNKTWVIDAALIDEIIAMTGEYKLATFAAPIGKNIATAWLQQLRKITFGQQVVALAYGNPDISMAQRLSPSELRSYYEIGKTHLESALARKVRSEPNGRWSTGKSGLNYLQQKAYNENRKALIELSRVVKDPQLSTLRAQLSKLLSPELDRGERKFYSYSASTTVNTMVHKLRINSGKYQVTTSNVKLPVTVINEFNSDVTINVLMLPINSRVIVDSFRAVIIPAQSKKQLEMNVDVIAPGQTAVSAIITDSKGNNVVPEAVLNLNLTVIDARVTWFTTGAAILVLLAGVAQSVRRVRKRVK